MGWRVACIKAACGLDRPRAPLGQLSGAPHSPGFENVGVLLKEYMSAAPGPCRQQHITRPPVAQVYLQILPSQLVRGPRASPFCRIHPQCVLASTLSISVQHTARPPLAYSILALCFAPSGDPDGAGGGQFLTLRRLVPWLSEPLRRMRLLAALGDAAEGLEGGELATVVYEYTRHGDPFVAAAASKLLQQVPCRKLWRGARHVVRPV